MAVSEDYKAFIEDQLSDFEGYYAKNMFGGVGYFKDGAMFGAIMGGVFRMKADDSSKDKYLKLGGKPFEMEKGGKVMSMPYYEVPQKILEDKKMLSEWAEEAAELAIKTKKKKK